MSAVASRALPETDAEPAPDPVLARPEFNDTCPREVSPPPGRAAGHRVTDVTGTNRTTPDQAPFTRPDASLSPRRGADLGHLLPVGRCYRTHKENEDKGLDED